MKTEERPLTDEELAAFEEARGIVEKELGRELTVTEKLLLCSRVVREKATPCSEKV